MYGFFVSLCLRVSSQRIVHRPPTGRSRGNVCTLPRRAVLCVLGFRGFWGGGDADGEPMPLTGRPLVVRVGRRLVGSRFALVRSVGFVWHRPPSVLVFGAGAGVHDPGLIAKMRGRLGPRTFPPILIGLEVLGAPVVKATQLIWCVFAKVCLFRRETLSRRTRRQNKRSANGEVRGKKA